MRVLLNGLPVLTPLSGVGYYVHCLSKAMQRLSPEDSFFFFYNGYWSSNLKPQPSPTAKMVRGLSRRFAPVYSGVRLALDASFKMVCRFGRFDLYHETCFIPFPFKGPTIVSVLDLSFYHYPETHPPERVRYFNKHFYSRLDRVSHFVTISNYVKEEMVRYLGISPEKITVTYPGVDDVFNPRSIREQQDVCRRYGIVSGAYILYVGNLEPRKNLQLLLRAYAGLNGSLRQKYPLVLAGATAWKQEGFSEQINRLGIEKNIRRVGYVPQPELPALYSGASVFVFPSLYEGFGLPPVEAMASGCPVIVSNGGSLPEVVGDAAAVVDTMNPDVLKNRLEEILQDAQIRNVMRESGLVQARQFRWNQCAQDTLDVYRRFTRRW